MTSGDLARLAARVDTGADDPETSRALVVFNITDAPRSGAVVFKGAMGWAAARPLPPVRVTGMRGEPIASHLAETGRVPDESGAADSCRVSLELRFAVRDVPARGWRTYLAAYVDSPDDAGLPGEGETAGLIVVETLRHPGDLPPQGTFAELPPSMVE